MQKIERLITQSRRDTDNEDYSDTTGIPDISFLNWATRAQRHIQSKILEVFPKAFQEETYANIVPDQVRYQLPAGLFLGTRLENVEASTTGKDKDFYPLYAATKEMQRGLETNKPYWFIRQGSQILLMPAGNTGKLRYTYQKDVPTLDKKRGTIQSMNFSCTPDGVCTVNSLTLEQDLTDEDVTEMLDVGYITLLRNDGEICFYNVKVTEIDIETGVVTIPGGLGGIGTNIADASYVVAGKRATNYSQLPDACEDYISAFLDYKALRKDTASDAAETSSELLSVEAQILAAYAMPDNVVHGIPIIDDMYLCPEG